MSRLKYVPDVTTECIRQANWGRCEFYECLERRFPCGSDGYINRVALHFCHKVASIFDSFNERVIYTFKTIKTQMIQMLFYLINSSVIHVCYLLTSFPFIRERLSKT